jgi:hypothetical protein
MHGQTEAAASLRQDGHHPARGGFQRAADDTSISKTRYKAPTLHPGLDLLDTPRIQDMMQEYICPHGRHHPALRRALGRVRKLSRLQHASVQPLADEPPYPPIIAPLRDKLAPVVPVEMVENSTDIRIDSPVEVQLPALCTPLVQRVLLTGPFLTPWEKAGKS